MSGGKESLPPKTRALKSTVELAWHTEGLPRPNNIEAEVEEKAEKTNNSKK